MKDSGGTEIIKIYKIDQEDNREETLIKREENEKDDNFNDVVTISRCNGTKA